MVYSFFTYMIKPDGTTRYNCSIIALNDQSSVAILNVPHITDYSS